MNINLLCAKLDGLDIGQHEDPPAYDQSYDLIIPLVRKLTNKDTVIKIIFLSEMPPIISATPTQWAEAIVNASGIK